MNTSTCNFLLLIISCYNDIENYVLTITRFLFSCDIIHICHKKMKKNVEREKMREAIKMKVCTITGTTQISKTDNTHTKHGGWINEWMNIGGWY